MKREVSLMTEGSVWKQILVFSVPLILGNLLQQLYNAADSVIVGNFVGRNALAAVGSSTSLINLLIAFSQGAATGAGVIVAQHLGGGNREGVNRAVHTAIAIALILGIFLSVFGFFMSGIILTWMNVPEEVFPESVLYFRIYFCGVVFNVLYNMCAGILNAAGNSRRSLIYLGTASVTNIFLDLFLVGPLGMGVAGAAIATTASQLAASVLSLSYLMRTDEEYKIKPKEIRIAPETAKQIVIIGLPAGIQSMVISLSNVLIQSTVNGYGPAAMAGFGAYMKIDGFNILPILSFSLAITTFTGQNLGAGNRDRVKQGVRDTVIMGVIYTFLIGAFMLAFSNEIIGLFSDDAEVIACGVLVMTYFCPYYSLLAVMHILAGAVRGTGKTIPPMLIMLASLCLFRILWIYFFLPFTDGAIGWVFLQYPVSWLVGAVMMAVYTAKSNWLRSSAPVLR